MLVLFSVVLCVGAPSIFVLWDFAVSIQADLLCFCCVGNERDGGTAVVNDDMGMQTPCQGYPVRSGGGGMVRAKGFICKQIREWGRPR